MDTQRYLIAALFAGVASAASAADNASLLTECVDLGTDQEIVRNGSSQSFLLRDGDAHYVVDFRGSCSSVAISPRISIATDGTANRLCPQGTKVETKHDVCGVAKVEIIGAEEFAARKKRMSR